MAFTRSMWPTSGALTGSQRMHISNLLMLSDTQCKKKIKKWELGKSLNKKAACAMLRIRKRRHAEGKETEFTYKGHKVSQEKLERSRRRLKGWDKEDETNPGIQYFLAVSFQSFTKCGNRNPDVGGLFHSKKHCRRPS